MLSNNIQIKNGRLIPTNVFTRDDDIITKLYRLRIELEKLKEKGASGDKIDAIRKQIKELEGESRSKDASPTESLLYAIELNKKAGNTELVEKLEKELAITKEKGLDSKTKDMRVSQPGWYVVNSKDDPIRGPFTETEAKKRKWKKFWRQWDSVFF